MRGLMLSRSDKRWLKILLLVPVIGAATLFTRDRAPQPLVDPPLGAWTTDNPGYAGRRFEIHKDLIVIAFSDDSVYTESISSVEAQPHDRRVRFTIHTVSYGGGYNPGDEHAAQWRFDYDPHGGTIHFEHQPGIVWQRVSHGQ